MLYYGVSLCGSQSLHMLQLLTCNLCHLFSAVIVHHDQQCVQSVSTFLIVSAAHLSAFLGVVQWLHIHRSNGCAHKLQYALGLFYGS